MLESKFHVEYFEATTVLTPINPADIVVFNVEDSNLEDSILNYIELITNKTIVMTSSSDIDVMRIFSKYVDREKVLGYKLSKNVNQFDLVPYLKGRGSKEMCNIQNDELNNELSDIQIKYYTEAY